MNQAILRVLLLITATTVAQSFAFADQPGAKQFKFEFKICQVLTNITGDGLTSQTLPGVNGSFQIVHEKLDDVKLVMDGKNLTWDGKDSVNNPRILVLSAPTMVSLEGQASKITTTEDEQGQYFEPKGNGLYELKTISTSTTPVGLQIEIAAHAAPDRPGVLACDFKFGYTWIKDREKIDGVNLAVGKPILGAVSTEGGLGIRLGEWSCYRTLLDGKGAMYVFVRATEKTPGA